MQKRGVVQKSERADLFRRLCELYAQQRIPLVDCVLPFPLLQIAEARVWRALPPPDGDDLQGALAAVGQQGCLSSKPRWSWPSRRPCFVRSARWRWRLKRFSRFTQSHEFFPDPSDALARAEFSTYWEAMTAEVGDAWVLAATRRPLLVRGRPSVVAPKVAAAIVVERLLQERRSEATALRTAGDLAAVLLDHPVRTAEVNAWRQEYRRVQVFIGNDPRPLTAHLADPFRAVVEAGPSWTSDRVTLSSPQLTPTDFLRRW